MAITQFIEKAIQASILAGIEIRNIYSQLDFEVQFKDDNTPVTLADYNANNIILRILEETNLPVISEENIETPYEQRKNWDLFWLTDPLDGTKEFIKRNDEFTVNIALISKNSPVAGVIYAPVSRELYVGVVGSGSWKLINPDKNCTLELIQSDGIKLPQANGINEYVVAVSRSHMNQETEKFIDELRLRHKFVKVISKGSSLKITMIAEGSADVYPKFGKTMEWDTAAGHAIVKGAGKNIFTTDLDTELSYNKESLYNPNFIVI